MLDDAEDSRRGFLKCMAWAGTGALFAFNGGVGSSIGLDSAIAAPLLRTPTAPFTFVQVSDSHIGFNKPPNADARATFREAVAKVKALPVQSDFIIHTGDVSQRRQRASPPPLQDSCRSLRLSPSDSVPGRCTQARRRP